MNKGDLVSAVAELSGAPRRQVDQILTAALEVIEESIANGEKVTLVGFGTFEPRKREARNGRNPKTGEAIEIPAAVTPAFSAGKSFKEKVAASA